MKKLLKTGIVWFLAGALALSVTACGGTQAPASAPAKEEETKGEEAVEEVAEEEDGEEKA